MTKDCSLLSNIINELFADIANVKAAWEIIRDLNPHFEQVSEDSWRRKEACLWLHGETDVTEANELERWLCINSPVSKTAKSLAEKHYNSWSDYIREEGAYIDFNANDLPPPLKNEILNEYIVRLSQKVEAVGWGPKKRERATKAFLHYLRTKNTQAEIAFIEHIFPEKCDLRAGKIIRIIRPQVYPIPKEVAGAIIRELAYQCAYGRPNARHHAGEALALIWLSLSSSRIRWPRSLESVHAIRSSAIKSKPEYFELLAPSIFGPHPVRISKKFATFFQAIASIPSKKPRNTILQTPLADLRKTLNAVLKKVNPAPKLGEITFLTFLSHPHPFGEQAR